MDKLPKNTVEDTEHIEKPTTRVAEDIEDDSFDTDAATMSKVINVSPPETLYDEPTSGQRFQITQFSPAQLNQAVLEESEFPEMESLTTTEQSNVTNWLSDTATRFFNLYSIEDSAASINQGVDLASHKTPAPGLMTHAFHMIGHASQAAGVAGGAALSGVNIASSTRSAIQNTTEAVERYTDTLNPRQELLTQVQKHFQDVATPMKDGDLARAITTIGHPGNDPGTLEEQRLALLEDLNSNDLGTEEDERKTLLAQLHESEPKTLPVLRMLRDVLEFAANKEQKRIARAASTALGNSMSAAGGVLALAGAAGAGIGAAPGIIVSAIGSGISLAPSIGQAFNNIVKRISGAKGVDREAVTKFIWGFALRHEAEKPGNTLRQAFDRQGQGGPAFEALKLADEWAAKAQSPEELGEVQQTAFDYVHHMGLVEYQMTQDLHLQITDNGFGQVIFRDLGSVPGS